MGSPAHSRKKFRFLATALLLYLVLGSAALFYRQSLQKPPEPLRVDRVSTHRATAGTPLQLTIEGAGFSPETSVSIYPDDSDHHAVVSSLATWGFLNTTEIVGNLAYLANGYRGMQVVDIADPRQPRIIGSVATPGKAFDITVQGNLAYVACGKDGLAIIDIASPRQPRLIGRIDTPGEGYGIQVEGALAFLADGVAGLQIIDILEPASPRVIANFDSHGFTSQVKVVNGLAYLASGHAGLQVIDISKPMIPKLLAHLPLSSALRALELKNTTAYLATNSHLFIADITDPAAPRLVGSQETVSFQRISQHDNRLWLASKSSGLIALDISKPTTPNPIGLLQTSGNIRDISFHNDLALVSLGLKGLKILDTKRSLQPVADNPLAKGLRQGIQLQGKTLFASSTEGDLLALDLNHTPPAPMWHLEGLNGPKQIEVRDGYAYVIDRTDRLQIFNLQDPLRPEQTGSLKLPGIDHKLRLHGNRAFILSRHSELLAVDIADPSRPRLVGACKTAGNALDLAIAGDKAYIADGYRGLQVIDIGSAVPQPLVALPLPGRAGKITVKEGLALLGTVGGSFHIVDISNPNQPELIGRLPNVANISGIELSNDKAFLLQQGGSILVADLQDPMHPQIIARSENTSASNIRIMGRTMFTHRHSPPELIVLNINDDYTLKPRSTVSLPEEVHSLAIADGMLYAAGDSGVQAVDISDLDRPRLAGSNLGFSRIGDVKVRGGFAYLADKSKGLRVLNIQAPGAPRLAATLETPGVARSIALMKDVALLTSGRGGLQIIDISQPESPRLLKTLTTPGQAEAVWVEGTTAYLADDSAGVHSIDLSDPQNPRVLGTFALSWPANHLADMRDIAVKDGYGFVAAQKAGLLVLDLRHPAKPQLAAMLKLPGFTWDISLRGDYAYVSAQRGGGFVIDIANPEKPRIIASRPFSQSSMGVFPAGDRLVVTGPRQMTIVDFPVVEAEDLSLEGSHKLSFTLELPKLPGLYNLRLSTPQQTIEVPGALMVTAK